jgi:predicted DNA-binding transcriptional regulator AlpA
MHTTAPPAASRHLPPRLAEPLQPEQLLAVPDVALLLDCSVRSVWRLVRQGRLPRPLRLSRKLVRWPAAVVVAWLQRLADAQARGQLHDPTDSRPGTRP